MTYTLKPEELVFVPLGGCNEIGMNVNLYGYKGKWIMMDLGAGFADSYYPGVQMLAPDLSFVQANIDNFLGIVLTHAHEDHLGSVGYLWDQLRCPIYASPFTAAVARHKLQQEGLAEEAKITIIPPGSRFEVGPFDLQFIHITHSVPEMNAVALRTEYGTVLHTGDWKIDDAPVEGDVTDEAALKALGEEGVLAMVCDSTNVFDEKHSGSEGALEESLAQLMRGKNGLVVVSTFASNVARLHTIAKAAKANGRKVALAGLSLKRISGFARDTGFMQDIDPFLDDREIGQHRRDNLVVIATGCQGEHNAAMHKILFGHHPNVKLRPKDTVIFSSKIIPGNEKRIFRLFNRAARMGLEVLTEKDHFVHVSGHPSRPELRAMYEWVKPHISIPVHGEPVHIKEHAAFAKEIGVPKALQVENGSVVRLAPKVETLASVPYGYLAVDGLYFNPGDGDVMTMRRKMQDSGLVYVVLPLNKQGKLVATPLVRTPGVLDLSLEPDVKRELEEAITQGINRSKKAHKQGVTGHIRSLVKKFIKMETGKTPAVEVHALHIGA